MDMNSLPSGVAQDYAARLATRLRDRQRIEAQAHQAAKKAADFDKTDPFTYDRVYSHMINGIGEQCAYTLAPTPPKGE